jgi:hypothetical protein
VRVVLRVLNLSSCGARGRVCDASGAARIAGRARPIQVDDHRAHTHTFECARVQAVTHCGWRGDYSERRMALVSLLEPFSTRACVDAVCPEHGVYVVRSIGRHSDVVHCCMCEAERETLHLRVRLPLRALLM